MNLQQEKWQAACTAVEQLQALDITVCNVYMATKSPVITIEPHPNLPLTAPFTEIAVRQAAGDLVRIRTGMFAGCTVRWITGKHIHDTPKTH